MFKVRDKVIASRVVLGNMQGEYGFEIPKIKDAPVDNNWHSCFVVDMLRLIGTELEVTGIDLEKNGVHLYPGGWQWSPLSLDKVEDMNKDINGFTRDELRRIASKKNIPGRGNMTKMELFNAIYGLKPVEVDKKEKLSLGKELLSKIKKNSTCHYAYLSGKVKVYQNDDICHARLRSNNIDEAVLNIKWHYDNHKNKEKYKWFVMWMIKDSPFKNCFITKNWQDAYEDGVYLNCNESINRIVTSAIALRGGSEYPTALSLMHEFVEEGYDPVISWFLSYQFNKEGKNWYYSGDGGGAHKVFAISTASTENMKKFFKEGFHIKQDKPANEYAKYYEVFACLQGEDNTYRDNRNLFYSLHEQFKIPTVKLFGASERMSQKKFHEGLSRFQEFMLS